MPYYAAVLLRAGLSIGCQQKSDTPPAHKTSGNDAFTIST